jgi:hypothetical protein
MEQHHHVVDTQSAQLTKLSLSSQFVLFHQFLQLGQHFNEFSGDGRFRMLINHFLRNGKSFIVSPTLE